MTEWIEWTGGECPILDAKAGQYELELRDGRFIKPNHPFAEDYSWHHACSGSISRMHDIIAYRLIEKEQSDLDWLEGEVIELKNSYNVRFGCLECDDFQAENVLSRVLHLIEKRGESKS
jgi:hypothetical protein